MTIAVPSHYTLPGATEWVLKNDRRRDGLRARGDCATVIAFA